MGLGPQTTANLKFSGIVRFEDVIKASDETIEKAAQRTPPFGSNLRRSVTKILQSTLRVRAELEYAADSKTPSAVVCHLDRRDNVPRIDQTMSGSNNSSPLVSYTLLVYTDQPGGCLVYRRNISSTFSFKVDTPPKFGRLYVQLIASLVGLDGRFRCCPSCLCGFESNNCVPISTSRKGRA
jgi:hypothetical protein